MKSTMEFTRKVGSYLLEHDLTQAELAAKIGIKASSLNAWLNHYGSGLKEPHARKLCEVPPELRRGYVCPTFAVLSKNSSAMVVGVKLNAIGIQTHEERDGINDSVRVACVRGFHSFRHTAITLALRNGAGTPKTQKLAGHKSVLMQQRYTHLDADDAGDAAASIGRFW